MLVLLSSLEILASHDVTCDNPVITNLEQEEKDVENNGAIKAQPEPNKVTTTTSYVDFLVAPLTGVISGWVRCKDYHTNTKLMCMLGGGTLGGVGEIINYFGLFDRNYLAWGILGIATSHLIANPLIKQADTTNIIHTFSSPTKSDYIGFGIGVLLPTGILTSTLGNYPQAIAPIISARSGYAMFGTSGMMGGLAGGAFDELLIGQNITDRHYITGGTLGMVMASLFGNSLLANSIGFALGTISTSFFEKEYIDNLLTPIKTANDLYTTLNPVLPTKQLDQHIEKQMLASIDSKLLIQLLSLKLLEYSKVLRTIYVRFENPTPDLWNSYQTNVLYFGLFVIPLALTHVASYSIDSYFDQKLYYDFGQKIFYDLFSNETALGISYDKSATLALHNLNADINAAVNSGGYLVKSATSTALEGGHSLGIILIVAPNLFTYNLAYIQTCSLVSKFLAKKRTDCSKKIIELETDLNRVFANDLPNIKVIAEKDGLNVSRDKVQQVFNDLKQHGDELRFWDVSNNIWHTTTGIVNWVIDQYFLYREIYNKRVPFEQSIMVQNANSDAAKLLSWTGNNAQTIENLKQALDRILIIEGKIYNQTLPKSQPEVRPSENSNKLILDDIEVGFDPLSPLISIKHLELEKGKVYAVTGRSGSGKTRLLYKIKGVTADGSYCKGIIQFPTTNNLEPKIVMVSQQDYFPLDYTFQEMLSYPDKVSSDPVIETKMKELIKEAFSFNTTQYTKQLYDESTKNYQEKKSRVLALNLTSKEDWKEFSGGEKKRFAIISALLKTPDILILDESFAGLDTESILIIQGMLKRLPNTLILVVDHQARCNNYNSFYDKELHVAAGTIVTRVIPSIDYVQD